MKIIHVQESENEKFYVKEFKLDEGIQLDSAIQVLRQFEKDKIKMKKCCCCTFKENGTAATIVCKSFDELAELENQPNPYLSFNAIFVNSETNEYQFNLGMHVNSNAVEYSVDKLKFQNLHSIKIIRENAICDHDYRFAELAKKKKSAVQKGKWEKLREDYSSKSYKNDSNGMIEEGKDIKIYYQVDTDYSAVLLLANLLKVGITVEKIMCKEDNADIGMAFYGGIFSPEEFLPKYDYFSKKRVDMNYGFCCVYEGTQFAVKMENHLSGTANDIICVRTLLPGTIKDINRIKNLSHILDRDFAERQETEWNTEAGEVNEKPVENGAKPEETEISLSGTDAVSTDAGAESSVERGNSFGNADDSELAKVLLEVLKSEENESDHSENNKPSDSWGGSGWLDFLLPKGLVIRVMVIAVVLFLFFAVTRGVYTR